MLPCAFLSPTQIVRIFLDKFARLRRAERALKKAKKLPAFENMKYVQTDRSRERSVKRNHVHNMKRRWFSLRKGSEIILSCVYRDADTLLWSILKALSFDDQ